MDPHVQHSMNSANKAKLWPSGSNHYSNRCLDKCNHVIGAAGCDWFDWSRAGGEEIWLEEGELDCCF